ncbi:MAG TPA: GNAT family N-acetyltransferase [Gaiellaceae bacterium]
MALPLVHESLLNPQTDTLLDLYDTQLRAHVPAHLPAGASVEREGPLVRTVGYGRYGWVEYRDLGDISEAELDRLIQAQIARFTERNEPFEWKFHSHDRPSFLEERLTAAGFVAEELETVMIAETAALADGGPSPGGVVLRDVRERVDFARIGEMEAAVWGSDESWYADTFEHELAADSAGLAVFVAEADGVVVAAGWVRFPSGTDFATLWGGATLAEWRGRGIYRALVFRRAQLAAERQRRYLEVDASADSAPILERLGFLPITQTRPYVWSPSR